MLSKPRYRGIMKGDIINETYKVVSFLGFNLCYSGYHVRHVQTNKEYALKILSYRYIEQTDIKQTIDAIDAFPKISHPNIMVVHEFSTLKSKGGIQYYVLMDYKKGESLNDVLGRKIRFELPLALSIIRDVLTGLKTLHNNETPIIPQDINPQNIILSSDTEKPVAALTDFCLVRSPEHIVEVYDQKQRLLYTAPESFDGRYSTASNVFTAGIILYKMITGVFPWQYDFDDYDLTKTDELFAMIKASREKPIRKPSIFRPEIDAQLEAIILKSLEIDSDNRFNDAAAFLESVLAAYEFIELPQEYWSKQNLFVVIPWKKKGQSMDDLFKLTREVGAIRFEPEGDHLATYVCGYKAPDFVPQQSEEISKILEAELGFDTTPSTVDLKTVRHILMIEGGIDSIIKEENQESEVLTRELAEEYKNTPVVIDVNFIKNLLYNYVRVLIEEQGRRLDRLYEKKIVSSR